MKAFTDIEQSKKLAEILPLDSADMFLAINGTIPIMAKYIEDGFVTADETAIPCWSLAALLDFLEDYELIRTSENRWNLRAWYTMYPNFISEYNPVDACYYMILELNRLNLLKNESIH